MGIDEKQKNPLLIKPEEFNQVGNFINKAMECKNKSLESQDLLKLENATIEVSKIGLAKDGFQWDCALFSVTDMRGINTKGESHK